MLQYSLESMALHRRPPTKESDSGMTEEYAIPFPCGSWNGLMALLFGWALHLSIACDIICDDR